MYFKDEADDDDSPNEPKSMEQKVNGQAETDEKFCNAIEQLMNSINYEEEIEKFSQLFYNELPSFTVIQKYNFVNYLIETANTILSQDVTGYTCIILEYITFANYKELDYTPILQYITQFLKIHDPYLPYALNCFLNMMNSNSVFEIIKNEFDFSMFCALAVIDENTEIDTLLTILEIITKYTDHELPLELSTEFFNIAVVCIESGHFEFIKPSLWLILKIFQTTPETLKLIDPYRLRQHLIVNLFVREESILTPLLEILTLLYDVGFRFEERNQIDPDIYEYKEFVKLFFHSSAKVVEVTTNLMLKILSNDDSNLNYLRKYKVFDEIFDYIESDSPFENKVLIIRFICKILINVSIEHFRRLIREKRYTIVFKLCDYQSKELTIYILPVLSRVFDESIESGKFDEIKQVFEENEGFDMIEELYSLFEEDEAELQNIRAFQEKYDMITE